MEPWGALADLARRQRGVVTLGQARSLGLDERTVQRHVLRYGWERTHRGTYALPGSTRSYERDVTAALLTAGRRSAASHSTAATLLGLQRAQSRPLHLVVPFDRRAPALRVVRTHRSRTLLTADVVRVGGLQTTSAARTLCDLSTAVPARFRELPRSSRRPAGRSRRPAGPSRWSRRAGDDPCTIGRQICRQWCTRRGGGGGCVRPTSHTSENVHASARAETRWDTGGWRAPMAECRGGCGGVEG